MQWDGLHGNLEGHMSSGARHLGAIPEVKPPGLGEIGPY